MKMNPKKRSIARDIQSFCGWDFLISLVEVASTPLYKAIISGLFLTGCRVSEFIQLRGENVNLDAHPSLIIVEDAPIVKRKGEYINRRTFPINKKEPLVPYFLEYIKGKRKKELLFPYSRVRIYQIVREVGRKLNCDIPFSRIHSSELYPHWFRAQRARQLRSDYGFTDEELRDWFGWKYRAEGMAAVYGKLSWIELAKKMGVEVNKRWWIRRS